MWQSAACDALHRAAHSAEGERIPTVALLLQNDVEII